MARNKLDARNLTEDPVTMIPGSCSNDTGMWCGVWGCLFFR